MLSATRSAEVIDDEVQHNVSGHKGRLTLLDGAIMNANSSKPLKEFLLLCGRVWSLEASYSPELGVPNPDWPRHASVTKSVFAMARRLTMKRTEL